MEEIETKEGFIPGHHECEICYGGEADLHKHYTSCKKNPGHVNFIPVNDFNLDHLPSLYRDVIMLEQIKALSALTVLIKVKYTSLARPKSVPCFSGRYPFYNTRGSDVLRTGTGRVSRVDRYTESDNKGTCPCGKCQHSDTPSKVWGEVWVRTATHVVFDDSEARQTKCVVGLDDNKSPGYIGETYYQDLPTKMEEIETKEGFIPGHHEAEICYGGEADLHKHYTRCKKNPGHVNFIPVKDFNLDHLPSRYRDVIMLEVIKALSALTVMIKVKYTSLERPKSAPCFSGRIHFITPEEVTC
ncbi:uncharacterized protein LOC131945136 [Physella acuta]|uniref:uncharacterized protein LOC131945136 n=1 Tax=Physella acuta TaxID=109671 RepID=UPI0027DB8F14|nr:uncharacterized protein LOC131945136 [Physella acuta]